MCIQFLNGIDNDIEKIMKDWGVPGCAVVIVKDGKIVHSRGYGYRDVAKKLPVTPDTVFAVGSISKSFTSMSLGLLVDDGLLDWDTPIKKYMPDFKMSDPVVTERLTARDMLCHRSGLPGHPIMWYNSSVSRKEMIKRIQYLDFNKDFRTTWQYNNIIYTTAGYLVEAITGQTWEEFVQNRIFNVLGMKNSNFSVTESQKLANFALPYAPGENGAVQMPFRNIDTIAPAGAINSNIKDMSKWLMLHLQKGKYEGKQFISEVNINEMHTPQMLMPSSPMKLGGLISTHTYGLGWEVQQYRGHKFVQHDGSIDGFVSFANFLPEENIGSIILCNLNGSYFPLPLAYTIFDRALGITGKDWSKDVKDELEGLMASMAQASSESKPAPKENTKPSHDLHEYVGKYESPGYGLIEIKQADNELIVTYNSFDMPLVHDNYEIFSFQQPVLGLTFNASFSTNSDGTVGSVSIPFELDPSVKPITFTRN